MKACKDNRFATNKGGIIKAPKSVGSDSPKSTVVKGNDLGPKAGKHPRKLVLSNAREERALH